MKTNAFVCLFVAGKKNIIRTFLRFELNRIFIELSLTLSRSGNPNLKSDFRNLEFSFPDEGNVFSRKL